MKIRSSRRSWRCLREDNSGSILVLTLVVLGLLTAFCVQLGYVTRQKLTQTKKIERRERVRLAVDAGVKAGTVIVRESEGEAELVSLQPGYASGRFAREAGGLAGVARYVYSDDLCDVVMTVTDEGGKINVNRAPYVLISSVLEEVAEVDEDIAKDLACSIVDWRDPNDTYCHPQLGAEDKEYRHLPESYEAKDALFELLEEFLLVKGVDEEIYDKMVGCLTIHGSGVVNINSTSAGILRSLGLSRDLADKVVSYLAGSDGIAGNMDDRAFEGTSQIVSTLAGNVSLSNPEKIELETLVSRGGVTTRSSVFKVEAVGKAKARNIGYKIVSVVRSDGTVLSWQED